VGALLISDEIQCGLGRTGALWATTWLGVSPDVLLLGKALGGGIMPVSAVVATPAAFRPFDRDPFLHTSTFGGNPLASAAVRSCLEVVREIDVPERATVLGKRVRTILDDVVAKRSDLFEGVSGRGLMLGLHCRNSEIAGEFMRNCLHNRVLLTPCLTTPNVVRLTPPAVMKEKELRFAYDGMTRAALDVEAL
jgi:putrescine aminotransferase